MDGQGTTIAFADSSFAGDLIAVNGISIEREALDDTTMATTVAKAYIPAKIYDGGTLDLEVKHDPSLTPPVIEVDAEADDYESETCTITWPGGGTWEFDVCHTGYSPGASGGERMTSTLSCKITSEIDKTLPAP